MKKTIFILSLGLSYLAHGVQIQIPGNLPLEDQQVLHKAVDEATSLLPQKFIQVLPGRIKLKLGRLKGFGNIPQTLCGEDDQKVKFTFGKFNDLLGTLTLNKALLGELKKGRENSKSINCFHKNLYDQTIATIIHELTHAYDAKTKASRNSEFLNLASFKKGLLGIKARNINPLRSPDDYEMKNSKEAFAVNMEYFTLDPEFACRRPAMYEFFKKHFNMDPYPDRPCKINFSLMVTTSIGAIPVQIDPARVYRIDYLEAAPGKGIASSFGHSMYRLIICAPERTDAITGKTMPPTPFGPKCVNDKLYHLVLSYRANSGDGNLNYLKGLIGGYPSMLFVLSFPDVLDEYNRVELRDVISHPLKFSEAEKDLFLKRMLEDHWNYSGSYKFITNNCSTESRKLIQNDLSNKNVLPKFTPKHLLNSLVKSNLISLHSPEKEVFPSKTDNLISAYTLAYGHAHEKEKRAKKDLMNFALKSSTQERMNEFDKLQLKGNFQDERSYLHHLKSTLLQSASFSVIEQQVMSMKAGVLKKKLADFATDKKKIKKHPEIQELLDSSKKAQSTIVDISGLGYGVPLSEEMMSLQELQRKLTSSIITMEASQDIITKIFPEETRELDEIMKNLKAMNAFSMGIRRTFRKDLESYIQNELQHIDQEDLMKALETNDVSDLREKLDAKLVTEAEISDSKLLKFAQKALKKI